MTFTTGRMTPWTIAALLLAGVGIWLAGRAALSGPIVSVAWLPPPTSPTKIADRPAPKPLEAFLDAAGHGMSLQEVRWIVEDFQDAGLDGQGEDGMPAAALEWRQKEWYLQAVASGLSLDSDRKREMRRSLFSMPEDSGEWGVPDPPLHSPCPVWLMQRAAFPARMIRGLSPEALAVLRPAPPQVTDPEDLRARNPIGAGSGEPETEDEAGEVPEALAHAAWIFPFCLSQRFPSGEAGILQQVMVLHPAQFQILLLTDGIPAGLLEHLYDDE